MNRVEIADTFAQMLRKSRNDSGKSQDYIAKAMGVSKKTVQNWEQGTSSPNQIQAMEWFQYLNRPPLPYYLEMLYPSEGYTADDAEVDRLFVDVLKNIPTEQKRKLLFVIKGEHGSSPVSILEMVVAHLHTPLRDRLNIAQNIISNYEIAEKNNTLVEKDKIKPNMDLLARSFFKGKEAVINNRISYSDTLYIKEE